MPLAEAVAHESVPLTASEWLRTLSSVLLRPRSFFASLQPGPVPPAVKLAALYFAIPSLLGALCDEALWRGEVLRVLGFQLMIWLLATAWQVGPQAFLFRFTMRISGAEREPSLAPRGMAALSGLFCIYGVVSAIASIHPESAPYVITWYASLVVSLVLASYALYCFARGAYGLSTGKALGAVPLFLVFNTFALVLVLIPLFSLMSS